MCACVSDGIIVIAGMYVWLCQMYDLTLAWEAVCAQVFVTAKSVYIHLSLKPTLCPDVEPSACVRTPIKREHQCLPTSDIWMCIYEEMSVVGPQD